MDQLLFFSRPFPQKREINGTSFPVIPVVVLTCQLMKNGPIFYWIRSRQPGSAAWLPSSHAWANTIVRICWKKNWWTNTFRTTCQFRRILLTFWEDEEMEVLQSESDSHLTLRGISHWSPLPVVDFGKSRDFGMGAHDPTLVRTIQRDALIF